jgi:hypothetical protein
MNGDSLASEALDIGGCQQHIGHITATRIAYYGYFVYIYTQFCHNI